MERSGGRKGPVRKLGTVLNETEAKALEKMMGDTAGLSRYRYVRNLVVSDLIKRGYLDREKYMSELKNQRLGMEDEE